jgi:ABC-type uncharacterized transport system auxiliary subunit
LNRPLVAAHWQQTRMWSSSIEELHRTNVIASFSNGNEFSGVGAVTRGFAATLDLRATITFQKRAGHAAREVDGAAPRQIVGL